MEIGKKLRQARLDAGLSQRQLCQGVVTRNMLSQIENGSANPSMETLAQFAARLSKPVGYFLGDEETPPEVKWIQQAKDAYIAGDFSQVVQILKDPQGQPNDESMLLLGLSLLELAEKAITQGRSGYARQLLEDAETALGQTCYNMVQLQQHRLLLLAQVSPEMAELPADDRPLLYRARVSLQKGELGRCVVLLEACEDHTAIQWRYLRAEAAFQMQDFALAAEYYPGDCYARLEECYRNLGDYKMAYEYACKQR